MPNGTFCREGFVYRGTAIPELYGKYIFGDLALHTPPRADGRLFYADLTTGAINEFLLPQFATTYLPSSLTIHGFGQDGNGELYILATNTPSSGAGGVVYAMLPSWSYSKWAAQPAQGLIAGVNDGPLDDPGNDSVPNLINYALGGAPTAYSRPILPKLTLSGANVIFSYDWSALSLASVTQVVEYSTDLISWTPIVVTPAGGGPVAVTPGVPNYHIAVTIPASPPGQFVRLKVTK